MICNTCKESKSISDFYKYSTKSWCKSCRSKYAASKKEHYYKIKRKSELKTRYGLTLEDYDLMIKKQSGLCTVCQTPGHTNNRQKYPLYVDHNHQTGKVRGLLCASCNTMLGQLENSRHLLVRMETYLQNDGLENSKLVE